MTNDKIDELLRKLDFVAKSFNAVKLGLPIPGANEELRDVVNEWLAGSPLRCEHSDSGLHQCKECDVQWAAGRIFTEQDVAAIVAAALAVKAAGQSQGAEYHIGSRVSHDGHITEVVGLSIKYMLCGGAVVYGHDLRPVTANLPEPPL